MKRMSCYCCLSYQPNYTRGLLKSVRKVRRVFSFVPLSSFESWKNPTGLLRQRFHRCQLFVSKCRTLRSATPARGMLAAYPPPIQQSRGRFPFVVPAEVTMRSIKTHGISIFIIASLWLVVFLACQPATNTNNSNANINANTAPANTNANLSSSTTDSTSSFNASEPDKYSATLMFTIETSGGDKTMGVPPLSVQVARNGADRRVEFKLPDGTPLVYLDHDNHHYVIAPSRKQYAELNKEATGTDLQKLMTPGQIVVSLKKGKGVKIAGDETLKG